MLDNFLPGKKILITGGTSRLGRAFCEKALSAGAQLFFTYCQNQIAAQTLIEKGGQGFQLDLSSVKAMDEFTAALRQKIDHLDVLIHNAAAVRDHTLQNLNEEEWDYVMAVDLKAPYYLTKKLLPLLFDRKKGAEEKKVASKVFMITSRAAFCGGYGISNYAAAKAGLVALTKSLAQELGKKKILCNAVNPGFMESGMTSQLPSEVFEQHRAASPLGQFSNPEEVADFLVYLSSDRMSQVTGQTFHFESRKL